MTSTLGEGLLPEIRSFIRARCTCPKLGHVGGMVDGDKSRCSGRRRFP